MSLMQGMITRISIIVIIIDSIAFYVLKKRIKTLTVFFEIGIIALTVMVLWINVFYCLHRHGLQ